MNTVYKKNIGFAMVEIIVAAAIISGAFVAAMGVAQKSLYLARQALHTGQASFLLEEGAEVVRIYRDNTWTNISGLTVGTTYYPYFSGGTWILSTTSTNGTVGIFTRSVVFLNVNRDATTADIVTSGGTLDTGTLKVTVTVTWNEGGTSISKVLPFYILNIFS